MCGDCVIGCVSRGRILTNAVDCWNSNRVSAVGARGVAGRVQRPTRGMCSVLIFLRRIVGRRLRGRPFDRFSELIWVCRNVR